MQLQTYFALSVCLLLLTEAKAQFFIESDSTILLEGVVMDGDSLHPLANAHVIVNGREATLANLQGYFAIEARGGDTVVVTYIGFGSKRLVIPDSLITDSYYTYALLYRDTISLDEVVIYPWATKQQFKAAFLNHTTTPDPMQQQAQHNVDMVMYKANDMNWLLGDIDPTDPTYHNRKLDQVPGYPKSKMLPTVNPIGLIIFVIRASRGEYKPKTYEDFKQQRYD